MTQKMTSEGAQPAREEGVYYALRDYAGLGRRLLVLVIDGSVLSLYLVGLLATYLASGTRSMTVFHAGAASFLIVTFLYLVIMQRSRVGTLGYALTGVRIVALDGTRPSIGRMVLRWVFLPIGPLNALLDVVWLGGDPNRQTLRDKFAGTYVIRKSAQVLGHGIQRYATYSLLGYMFTFREVSRGVT